ncbi:MAG TPA: hypothetical protein ENI73_04400 [Spirochaetes bacterium]|nr:hypothetical protein [Spirochaetota bacterium]
MNHQELIKKDLEDRLLRQQQELVHVLKEELGLSLEYPPDEKRLKEQADTRYILLEEISKRVMNLIDMGATFNARRIKGNNVQTGN